MVTFKIKLKRKETRIEHNELENELRANYIITNLRRV